MSRENYLKTKLPAVCASLFGMLFLTLFLLACGNSAASILFILTAWLVFFLCCEEISWRMRKKYLDSLLHMAEHLEEKYLIAEVMDVPKRADDRVFYELMKIAEKSMLETVGEGCGRKKHSKAYGKTAWRMVRTPCTAVFVSIAFLAYFIQSISAEISAYIGYEILLKQIFTTGGILLLLLICYFISTWILFSRSVER